VITVHGNAGSMNAICACTARAWWVSFPGVDTPGYKDATPPGLCSIVLIRGWKGRNVLKPEGLA